MAFLDIFKRDEKRSGAEPVGMFPAIWDVFTGTHNTAAGEVINETIAIQHATVYTCVRIIAEAIGSMTLRLYRKQPRGREEQVDNPLHWMLSVEPNSDMSAPVLWESLAGSMALTGMAYAEILRNVSGDPVGLYPIDPRQTEPVRLPNKLLAYRTTVGASKGTHRIIAAADMLAFPLFSFDGLKALSPIAQARNSVALSIAAEKFGARFFGNGSRPSGILTQAEGSDISDEELANMRPFWEKMNSAENQGRVAVIPGSWNYQQLSITPEDSQFLETRQLSRTDIAALFRVPPSKVGDVSKQSKASAEEENLSFVIDTLRPYMVRIETEIKRKLFNKDRALFVRFDDRERLRGDFATTMQGIATARQWGVIDGDEAREMLDLNPTGSDIGKVIWAPVNIQNAERLLDTAPVADQPLLALPNATGTIQDEDDALNEDRNVFADHLPVYASIFRDVVGRTLQRSKRDAETLAPIFSPTIESITALVTQEARSKFNLTDDWQPSDKISKEYLKAAVSRATEWTAENRDSSAATELIKCGRTLRVAIYREAGAALALKESPNE